MKYTVLLERGRYALIERGEQLKEIAVVTDLDKEKGNWGATSADWRYEYKGCPVGGCDKAVALSLALDFFRVKTESTYIARPRLEELVTLLKDGLLSDDEETAMEYFDEVCEMTGEEKTWFGVNGSEYSLRNSMISSILSQKRI